MFLGGAAGESLPHLKSFISVCLNAKCPAKPQERVANPIMIPNVLVTTLTSLIKALRRFKSWFQMFCSAIAKLKRHFIANKLYYKILDNFRLRLISKNNALNVYMWVKHPAILNPLSAKRPKITCSFLGRFIVRRFESNASTSNHAYKTTQSHYLCTTEFWKWSSKCF